MSASASMTTVLVAAVNDRAVLRTNLGASPDVRCGELVVHEELGHASAGAAYAPWLHTGSGGDVIIFVHQDVYLPAGFCLRLRAALSNLKDCDSRWGILSCLGRRRDGSLVGRAWSSGLGRALGSPLDGVSEVAAVDEMLLIVRRDIGLRFDERLPGFHCFAADLVATAAERGMKTYVADMPVVHNSQPVRRLDDGYIAAYRYMQRKWRHRLPLDTLIAPITRWGLPLYRARLRLMMKRLFSSHTFGRRESDPHAIAERCGFVDPVEDTGYAL